MTLALNYLETLHYNKTIDAADNDDWMIKDLLILKLDFVADNKD